MSTPLTIGVEEEYLLVDAVSRRPLPVGAELARGLSGVDFECEFAPAQAEFVSPVCADLDAVHRELTRGRHTLAAAARTRGALLLATGSPPLGRPGPPPVTDKPRYLRMAAHFGALADHQGVCGCHVHVGVPDAEHAIRASNHIRPWLPVLLLLSANSPFFDGRDTGHSSWRTSVWSRWPVAGPPPHFGSAGEYHDAVTRLIEAEVIADEGMVYWYVRPSHHAPTVEVRVADVAATVGEAALQAALTRALVQTAFDSGRSTRVSDALLRAACAQAALVGLGGRCLDPATGRPATGWHLVDSLVDHVRSALRDNGDLELVTACLAWMREHGGGACRQRRVLRERGDLRAVVDHIARATTA